jgi:hypothetical protein
LKLINLEGKWRLGKQKFRGRGVEKNEEEGNFLLDQGIRKESNAAKFNRYYTLSQNTNTQNKILQELIDKEYPHAMWLKAMRLQFGENQSGKTSTEPQELMKRAAQKDVGWKCHHEWYGINLTNGANGMTANAAESQQQKQWSEELDQAEEELFF